MWRFSIISAFFTVLNFFVFTRLGFLYRKQYTGTTNFLVGIIVILLSTDLLKILQGRPWNKTLFVCLVYWLIVLIDWF